MTWPLVEISHACIAACAKVPCVKVVVCITPLALNRLGTMASKIMQSTKLPKDSSAVQFEPCRIPFHTALPVVAAKAGTMLPTLMHDESCSHSRARTKLIRVHMWPFQVWHLPFDDHARQPRTFHWDAWSHRPIDHESTPHAHRSS